MREQKIFWGTIFSVTFLILFFVSFAIADQSVYFHDPNLATVILEEIGKEQPPIYAMELDSVTHLNGEDRGITDLSGLSYCSNLVELNLRQNAISDINELSQLNRLVSLKLGHNYITNIDAIGQLHALDILELDNNFICSIDCLKQLSLLRGLNLQSNCIKSLAPLEDLQGLSSINLYRNWVSDIGPLYRNEGIDQGDTIDLRHNLLTGYSCTEYITAIIARGAEVTYDQFPVGYDNPVVLDFPIYWAKGMPYSKYLPCNNQGYMQSWSCGKVAYAMIIRYWSLQTTLKSQGSYWYDCQELNHTMKANYEEPMQWEQMLPTISDLDVNDPRVEPIATFAYKICVAGRVDWFKQEEGQYIQHNGQGTKEYIGRYFGIDVSEYNRMSVDNWLSQEEGRSWDDLHTLIKEEIDAGRPCEHVGQGHERVITGYRWAGDHYEFSINSGRGRNYDPSQFYRLVPVGDKIDSRDIETAQLSWGIKPYEDANQAPRYNKIDEYSGSIGRDDECCLAWNGEEYAAVLPAGSGETKTLVFQRIAVTGLPAEESTLLNNGVGNPVKTDLKWGNGSYGFVWYDSNETGYNVYFNLLSVYGEKLLDEDVCIGFHEKTWPGLALAWNGHEYAVVWRTNYNIHFMRISSDGVPLRDTLIDLGRRHDPDIIWMDGHYYVAWADYSHIYLAVISPEQGLLCKESFVIETATDCRLVQLAFSGEEFGITWYLTEDNQRLVAFARATIDGRFIEDSQIIVSDRGGKIRDMDLSYVNDQFYLTFMHCCSYEAYISSISSDGTYVNNQWLLNNPVSVSHAVTDTDICVLLMKNRTGFEEERIEVETSLFSSYP